MNRVSAALLGWKGNIYACIAELIERPYIIYINLTLFEFIDLLLFTALLQVVQNLDELTLDSRDISMLSDENVFRPDLFSSIKVLQVHCYHQESAILPFGFIQNFTNLDNLNVGCCKFRELFPSESLVGDPRKPLGTVSGIRTLKLVLLSSLRHIWKPNSRPDLIPPYLESLVVWIVEGWSVWHHHLHRSQISPLWIYGSVMVWSI